MLYFLLFIITFLIDFLIRSNYIGNNIRYRYIKFLSGSPLLICFYFFIVFYILLAVLNLYYSNVSDIEIFYKIPKDIEPIVIHFDHENNIFYLLDDTLDYINYSAISYIFNELNKFIFKSVVYYTLCVSYCIIIANGSEGTPGDKLIVSLCLYLIIHLITFLCF